MNAFITGREAASLFFSRSANGGQLNHGVKKALSSREFLLLLQFKNLRKLSASVALWLGRSTAAPTERECYRH